MVSIGRTNSGSGTSASVYKPAGSVAFASLPVLGSTNEGKVYNVTDAFTTTSDFVEGSGKSYPAGTNVVCIDAGSSVYKWDVLSGFIDLSGYATAAQGAKADTAVQPSDLATVATSGSYSDLLNKPTIPTVDQTYDGTSANAQSGVAVASAISGKADDNAVVHIASTETITGNKTFTGSLTIPTPSALSNDTTAATTAFVKSIGYLGLPSTREDNLTIGASGASYTAPADGWVCLYPIFNGTGWCGITNFMQTNVDTYGVTHECAGAQTYQEMFLPVRKNDVFVISYSNVNSWGYTKFIYAKDGN